MIEISFIRKADLPREDRIKATSSETVEFGLRSPRGVRSKKLAETRPPRPVRGLRLTRDTRRRAVGLTAKVFHDRPAWGGGVGIT
ncbi:hypothetical protein EVAR_92543_1 [Eumeta japonica]|uniref:Uncharacterized protein n=1 Tax=Eumeta variegata TaxID=151549 RepID=A0A4C1SWI1_EUMVA|nr:hypothetical protein EVAR_92543_1 [Eumeta japonica]